MWNIKSGPCTFVTALPAESCRCSGWCHVSSLLSVFLCLAGRKAGCVGSRLLGDSVQTFGPFAHGPRSKQLQTLSSPQPVCHPQKPVHQRHAGKPNTLPLALCLSVMLKFYLLNYTFFQILFAEKRQQFKKNVTTKCCFALKDSIKLCVHNMRLKD